MSLFSFCPLYARQSECRATLSSKRRYQSLRETHRHDARFCYSICVINPVNVLLRIRAWCRKIQHEIEQAPKSDHTTREGKRNRYSPIDTVRAVISFDNETIRSTQAESEGDRKVQKQIRNAAWAAFAAATIYAFISLLMWRQMIKQNGIATVALKQSTASLQIDERAWVGISGFTLRTPETVGSPFIAEIWTSNSGKTPAIPIAAPVFMFVSEVPVARLQELPTVHENFRPVMFPLVRYGPDLVYSTMGGNSRVIGVEDINAYNSWPSRLWIYVYGRLVYKDVFENVHTTSYCAVSNGTNSFGGCPEGTYPDYAN